MPFLNSPLLYVIAFLVATNIVSALGWKVASSEAGEQKQKVVACQAKHDAFVGQVRAQGELAKEKAKAEEAENARIADETSRGWAAAIAVVRAERLRNATSRGSGSGGLSAPAEDRPGNAPAGADAIPSPERLAADCAEATVTANYLQSYIERMEQ